MSKWLASATPLSYKFSIFNTKYICAAADASHPLMIPPCTICVLEFTVFPYDDLVAFKTPISASCSCHLLVSLNRHLWTGIFGQASLDRDGEAEKYSVLVNG
jgi:hypothetical protein